MSTLAHPLSTLALIGHLLVFSAVSWVLLRWCRDISRMDARLGTVVKLGVLARLALGAVLFWASYLDWAPLQGLHSADGFWELAPDARSYFLMAATASEEGLSAIQPGSPSPTFVGVLAVWMRMVGATPTASVLLNTLLAAGSCRLAAGLLGADDAVVRRAARLLIAGLALSPALVLFAAQGLKDQFVVTMLVVAAAGVSRWFAGRDGTSPRHAWTGWAVAAAAVLAIAGVRAYLCAILIAVFAAATLFRLALAPTRWRRQAAGDAVAVLALWLVFMAGAGVYYQPYGAMLARLVPAPVWSAPVPVASVFTGGLSGGATTGDSLGEAVEGARAGFLRTPGATNLARPFDNPSSQVERILRGLAAIFLPITVLKEIGLVEFTGGRGLLAVTDLDSIVNLSLILAVGGLLAPRWRALARIPYAWYAVGFLTAVTLPMAYTVTNFGTLFRLRLMVFALIWLLVLVVIDARARERLGQVGGG